MLSRLKSNGNMALFIWRKRSLHLLRVEPKLKVRKVIHESIEPKTFQYYLPRHNHCCLSVNYLPKCPTKFMSVRIDKERNKCLTL